jgi:hypothetical protein
MYVIQQCFIFRPLDSTVSEDAGIESRTVETLALTARHSNHSARFISISVLISLKFFKNTILKSYNVYLPGHSR